MLVNYYVNVHFAHCYMFCLLMNIPILSLRLSILGMCKFKICAKKASLCFYKRSPCTLHFTASGPFSNQFRILHSAFPIPAIRSIHRTGLQTNFKNKNPFAALMFLACLNTINIPFEASSCLSPFLHYLHNYQLVSIVFPLHWFFFPPEIFRTLKKK